MKRKTYIDAVKIIAIILVLFNHTAEKGFALFTIRLGSPFYLVYLLSSIICKVAVPLFFMASGALLLGKEETVSEIIRKRFIRFLLCLILFSGVVYIFKVSRGEITDYALKNFIKQLYAGTISVHFWYLYAYLAYMLMLPLMRKFAKSMTMNDFKWMLLMCAFIQLIPMFEFVIFNGEVKLKSDFRFFITASNFLYPIMGYFIETHKEDIKVKTITLICGSFFTLVITCILTHYKCVVTGQWDEGSAQTFFNNLRFIPAGTIFLLSKRYFDKHKCSNRLAHWLSMISGLTFGIYVLEYVYRKVTEPVFYHLEPYLCSFLASIAWVFVAFVFGGIVTYILKHIPGIKKII